MTASGDDELGAPSENGSVFLVKHPLADSTGEGSARNEVRRRIVMLNYGRLDLLRKVAAAGGRTIVVTDSLSNLTEPLRDLLESMGGAWVVRGGDGRLRNGLDGRRLERFEDAITVGPPKSVDDVAVDYLWPRAPEATQLIVTLSLRHRARAEALLGGAAELLTNGLWGHDPSGWGTHEPAGSPWNRGELTEFARRRMPESTRLVVAGTARAPASLTLTAQRTRHGVEELVTGLLGAGPHGDAATAERIATVPTLLAEVARRELPLFGLVLARSGTADLSHPPVIPQPPRPIALLIGAPAVRDLGLDVESLVERHGASVTGRPRLPALVFRLAGDDVDPGRLAALLDDIGWDRVREATGTSALQMEEMRRAAED